MGSRGKIVDLYNALDEDKLDRQMAEHPGRKILKKRHEDFLIEHLLRENGVNHSYVEVEKDRAFDVIREGMVTNKTINPHRLKTDAQYLWVTAMFDENGSRGLERDGIDLERELKEESKESN